MEMAMAGAATRSAPRASLPSMAPGVRRHDRGVFLRRRVLLAALLAVMVGPWLGPVRDAISGPSGAPVPVSRGTYLVLPGDTLWAIAGRLAPGEDPRPLVDAIAEANGLGVGGLEPGTTLVIPAR